MAKKPASKKKSETKADKAVAKKAEREVKDLTARAEKAEAKADRWKAEAKRAQAEAADSGKQLKKLRKRLDAALSASAPVVEVGEVAEATGLVVAPAVEIGTVEEAVEEIAGAGDGARPDVTWTVTALRVAARDRGITGYSRRTKAELLRLLTE
jgi:chromosome segregation ATPase